MTKKKTEKLIAVITYLPAEDDAKLKEAAKKEGRTVASYVREALRKALGLIQ